MSLLLRSLNVVPTLQLDGTWAYESSTGPNVRCSSPIVQTNGVDNVISIPGIPPFSTAVDYESEIKFRYLSGEYFFASRSSSASRLFAYVVGGFITVGVYDGVGVITRVLPFTDTLDIHTLAFSWDSVAHDLSATLDGVTMPDVASANVTPDATGTFIGARSTTGGNYAAIDLYDLSIQGREYIFTETTGDTLYDSSGNGNDGTIINPTSAAVWQWSEYQRPHALIDGCNNVGGVIIPADASNPGYDVLGNTLATPGGVGFRDAGTELLLEAGNVALATVDEVDHTTPLWYSSGVPQSVSYSELAAVGTNREGKDQQLYSVDADNNITNLRIGDEPLITPADSGMRLSLSMAL